MHECEANTLKTYNQTVGYSWLNYIPRRQCDRIRLDSKVKLAADLWFKSCPKTLSKFVTKRVKPANVFCRFIITQLL